MPKNLKSRGSLFDRVALANRMAEIRGQMMMLHGADYEGLIREHAQYVTKAMAIHQTVNEFAAVLAMNKTVKADGKDVHPMTELLLIAAAVEMAEGAYFLKGVAA